jgi:hypothetical protein
MTIVEARDLRKATEAGASCWHHESDTPHRLDVIHYVSLPALT